MPFPANSDDDTLLSPGADNSSVPTTLRRPILSGSSKNEELRRSLTELGSTIAQRNAELVRLRQKRDAQSGSSDIPLTSKMSPTELDGPKLLRGMAASLPAPISQPHRYAENSATHSLHYSDRKHVSSSSLRLDEIAEGPTRVRY